MTKEEARNYLASLDFVQARYPGRLRPAKSVNTIVIHRLAKNSAKGGIEYVQAEDDDRTVSWHATVDHVTGETTLHLYGRVVGWHCKYPNGTNAISLGVEIGGPMGAPISDEAHKAVRALCEAWCSLFPIKTIGSHRYFDSLGPRKNRHDPGPEFKHECLEGLGAILKF